MIVLITLKTLLHIHGVELILLQREQDLRVNRDRVASDHNALVLCRLHLIVPGMVPDILNGNACLGVSVEYFLHQVSGLRRHKPRDRVVRIQYFLI